MADENTATLEAPPLTAAEAEQSQKPTAEETISLDKAMEAFGDTFNGGKKKKKEAPAEKPSGGEKPEPAKDEKTKSDSADNREADHKKENANLDENPPLDHKPKPKTKAATKQPQLDETRLAEIAAEAGARASTEFARQEKEKSKVAQPVADSFKPPKEYVDQYETFKVMAKSKPNKYGSLPDDFKAFVKEEEDYIKDWKRNHPGEAWDGEADEHNAFYDRATPKYEDSDFRRAEIAAELGEARKELRKEVLEEVEPRLKKLDEMERAETLRALQPAVIVAAKSAVGSILKAINPAYEKFTEPTEFEKLKDEDPVAFDIAVEVGRDAVPFVTEVTRLWQSKGAVKAEDNNPLHRYIHDYATKMMELIKQLPSDEQERDGKKFATWDEFNKLSSAQKDRYWTLSDQDLITRKLLDAQEIAKERIVAEDKKLSSWAKRKGMSNGSAQNNAPKENVENKATEAKPLPAKESPGSPSVGSRTQVSPSAEPAPSSQPAWLQEFGSILSGRKL